MCALNIVLASLYAAPPILCRILWTLSAFFSASSAPHWSHFEEQYWQCLLRKSCWLSSTPLPDPFNIVLRTIEASAVQITMHCVCSVQQCPQCKSASCVEKQYCEAVASVQQILHFPERPTLQFENGNQLKAYMLHLCKGQAALLPIPVSIIIALGISLDDMCSL